MTDTTPANRPDEPAAPKRQLSLFDSTNIIVGIIIGSFIYEVSPVIAGCVPSFGALILVWVFGGLLSLIGALCYAELATAYPKEGGDYLYLTRAFGRALGFLFAWAQLWIVRPGSIGAVAYVFARYANDLWPLGDGGHALMIYAAAAIIVLTTINIAGVREGKWTQNLLTVIKVGGLLVIVAVGLLYGSGKNCSLSLTGDGGMDFRLAMILVLYTYGGWNEMAYVGAEVRNPKKNILRALVLGTVAVTVLYVLITAAFVCALGMEGVRHSGAVASDVARLGFGDWGGRAISLLICISALGSINGMVFTGARIYYAMGTEHRVYSWLGNWHKRLGTPVTSLLVQGAITLALIVGFGLYEGGFKSLVVFTTPIFWIFFLLVGVSLFVLRLREPDTPRPYRVPWYPVIPLLFCGSSLFMVWSSISWALDNRSYEALWAIGLLVVGMILACFDPRPRTSEKP